MWNLLLDAAYALISGEFSHWWSEWRAAKKSKEVANAPTTKPELISDLNADKL